MHFNLCCYQLKIDSHNKTFYKSLIVTRKQEPIIVTQKRKSSLSIPLQKTIKSQISHSVMSDFLQPHGLQPARRLCPWNSPGKNTGVGFHSLLQGMFLTQGLNLGLLHCRQLLYHLSHNQITKEEIKKERTKKSQISRKKNFLMAKVSPFLPIIKCK